MAVTVIALVTINEDEPMALARYLEATGPLLVEANARIVQRFKVDETVVGNRPAKTMIVVEYPDRAAVDHVFNSPEYAGIRPVRDQAFSDYHISIVTNDPLDSSGEQTGS